LNQQTWYQARGAWQKAALLMFCETDSVNSKEEKTAKVHRTPLDLCGAIAITKTYINISIKCQPHVSLENTCHGDKGLMFVHL